MSRYSNFQNRIKEWLVKCFGNEIAEDKRERNHRFLEEALELVQSLGCTREEALVLVDYVYRRPIGDPEQEVGGVRVTLSALCSASDIDEDRAAAVEAHRIEQPEVMEKIRIKQKTKPSGPLPQMLGYHIPYLMLNSADCIPMFKQQDLLFLTNLDFLDNCRHLVGNGYDTYNDNRLREKIQDVRVEFIAQVTDRFIKTRIVA